MRTCVCGSERIEQDISKHTGSVRLRCLECGRSTAWVSALRTFEAEDQAKKLWEKGRVSQSSTF